MAASERAVISGMKFSFNVFLKSIKKVLQPQLALIRLSVIQKELWRDQVQTSDSSNVS